MKKNLIQQVNKKSFFFKEATVSGKFLQEHVESVFLHFVNYSGREKVSEGNMHKILKIYICRLLVFEIPSREIGMVEQTIPLKLLAKVNIVTDDVITKTVFILKKFQNLMKSHFVFYC